MEEPADLDPPDSPRSGGETPPESPRSIASLEPNGDELEIDPEMASKAAVGSVVHLLQTTFKEIYARTEIEDVESPPPSPVTEKPSQASRSVRNSRASRASQSLGNEADGARAAAADDLSDAGEEKKDAEPVEGTAPEDATEDGESSPPEPVSSPPEPDALEEENDEEPPWHLVALDSIKARLASQHQQASSLLTYLATAHHAASVSDVTSSHALKRIGLIQSAHVPIPYSTLDLQDINANDSEAPFGDFALNLVGARHLVAANHERMLRVSGTLKMSANTSRTARKVDMGDISKKPGYLKTTGSLAKRMAKTLEISHGPMGKKFTDTVGNTAFAKTGGSVTFNDTLDVATLPPPAKFSQSATHPHVEYSTHIPNILDNPPYLEFVAPVDAKSMKNDPNRLVGDGTAPPPAQKHEVRNEGEQWDLDMSVLSKMGGKLHYLKNPRYDKNAINHTRVLTRPLATEQDLQPEETKYGHPKGDHGYVVAQPDVVEYLDYKVDELYTSTLYLRNTTAVSRGITVLPPQTQYFSLIDIQYPSDKRGILAPGMAAKVRVKFTPDSLANYEDCITVVSEGGRFEVKLWAHRPPPKLSIPKTLNVGACLVGDAKRKSFNCINLGGPARFRLMREEDYPIPTSSHDQIPALMMPPFTFSPTNFDLAHNEAVTLTIDYSPLELGPHERSFVIVCDNCHVTKYTLVGSSSSVHLRVAELNSVFIPPSTNDALALPPKYLDFDIVSRGATQTRTVAVQNNTPLDLAFRWDLRGFVPSQCEHDGWGGRPRSRQLCKGGGQGGVSEEAAAYNDPPNGFSIEPRYGVFPANALTTFNVHFDAGRNVTAPLSARDLDSVLVVEGVPPSAIPSEQQAGLLKNLKEHGHGKYMRMQAWFKAMDADGGGTIDRHELQSNLEAMGLAHHKRAIRETMELCDPDGDGEITITEFMDGITDDLQQAIDKNLNTSDIGDVQDAIRREVDCLAFTMRAAEEYVKYSFDPMCLSFPGELTAGIMYMKEVCVKNYSDVESEFEFGDAVYDATDLTIGDATLEQPSGDDYIVEVNPKRGVIAPNSSVTSVITFSAKPSGLVSMAIPISVQNSDPAGNGKFIKLSANVIGPRVRIVDKELDFGLVAVGGIKETTVEFTNDGDVPVSWAAVYLTKIGSSAQDELKQTATGKMAYGRLPGKGRSSAVSLMSTFSMPASATTESSISPSGFNIDSPHCKLDFSPKEGVLGPHETGKVTINCAAGKLPQRLRATLAFLTSDETKDHDYETMYVGIRGEVQSPKVYLDKTELSLGVTYVDVPVVRYVTLKNLSNLDTKFKWERPAGTSPSFHVDFEPKEGELGSKQVLQVKMTYTAKLPGMIDDVYACRIYGMPMPLGFSLKTISKGVVVGYELLEEGQAVPEPLCPPDAPQFIGDPEDVPTPDNPPKVHIPEEVPLFSRRNIRFVVRNFSAVPAKFKIHPRFYNPAEKEGSGFGTEGSSLFAGTATANTGKKKKMLLGNDHETTRVFQTKNGQEHTRARLEYEEDVEMLKTGKGYAIEVVPSQGVLVPWGVTEVLVRTYNNMPAVYKDDIVCDITGAPATRLDFKCKVVGCPLSLLTTSLGLDMVSNPLLPRMKFGEVALNCGVLTRKIAVKNSGPIDALLAWSVREANDASEDNRVVAMTFEEGEEGGQPLSVKLGLYEKPRFESPFDISPPNTLVSKHSEQTFTLTLKEVKTDQEIGDYKIWKSPMEVMMVADAQWQHKKELGGGGASGLLEGGSVAPTPSTAGGRKKTKMMHNSSADEGGSLERETMGAVKLSVDAMAIRPWLNLDKRRHGEKNALSEEGDDVEIKQIIKFSISAMEYKHYKETREVSDEMEQTFLLTNSKSIPFEFALNVEGPYKMLSCKTLSLPHPKYSTPGRLPWNVEKGRPFILPPNESVEISVGFFPKVVPLSDGSRDDIDESKGMKLDASGRLKVTFSTGQTQFVEMKGEMIRPLVAVSPSDYHFGIVHVEEHHDIMLFVINPTTVTANYKITHVPFMEPKRQRMILDPDNELNREHVDEPDVFEFSEYEGSQRGPTLPLPTAGYCLPDDKNRLHHHGGGHGKGPVFDKDAMGLTWKSGMHSDLVIDDKLRKMNSVNPRMPRAISVKFKPGLNKRYKSRFRIEVDEGCGADVLLTGRGTYEENKRKAPPPHV